MPLRGYFFISKIKYMFDINYNMALGICSYFLLQFIAIGAEQRNAIRRALNEDANKLFDEGDPNDPQLRRLRREMDEVNRLFDELERRARAEGNYKLINIPIFCCKICIYKILIIIVEQFPTVRNR